MLARRLLLLNACCSLSAGVSRAKADNSDEWICTTVDPPPRANFSLKNDIAPLGIDTASFTDVRKEFKLTDFGTQFLSERWRRSDGLTPNTSLITLGVAFLDNDPAKASFVSHIAPRWLSGPTVDSLSTSLKGRIAFEFGVLPSQAQIRISFDPKIPNKSEVGIRSLDVSKEQPTMNIADLFDHVVLHEFGHALGLRHEQANPASPIQWDENAIAADLSKSAINWPIATIRAQVEQKYSSDYACIGDSGFNIQSIMLYPIKKSWTKNGFSSPLNTSISPRDFKCLAGVYQA